MAIENLTIIGERINPGFASSKALLEACDIKGLQELAKTQAQKGARFLTINIGDRAERETAFLKELIQAVQEVTDLPLSFDYPNRAVQEVCLHTYDLAKAKGRKPIVNSITELRWDMLDVLKIQPARLVLMASERLEDGSAQVNETAAQIAMTAKRMALAVLKQCPQMSIDDLVVDVSLTPVACDTSNNTRRAVEAIKLIGHDLDLKGIHMLVGLSNLGIMLPKQALDGSRLSTKLESSFLTMTMPHGLDTILGTAGRDYETLPESDFVYTGFREAIALDGYDTILRVQQLYTQG